MINFKNNIVKNIQILEATTKEELCKQIEIIGQNFKLIDCKFSVTQRTIRRKKAYHVLLFLGPALFSGKHAH